MTPLAKSWLFVPANQPQRIAKAIDTAAGAVIVDLEDSVPESEKDGARHIVADMAGRFPGRNVWIRINGSSSPWRDEDLALAASLPSLQGIFLPKVETAADIPGLPRRRAEGGAAPGLGILVESARGVLNLHAILTSREEVSAVMFCGAQGADLMLDLGCDWSIDGPELLHARQHTLRAIRAAPGVTGIDGVFSAIADAEGLAQDTRLSRRLGYRARAVVHPAQIAAVNAIYAPQEAELLWARRIEQAFGRGLEQGVAAVSVDGRLVDYAMYRMAQRILGSVSR